MQDEVREELLKAQQSEMETVTIYKYLANKTKNQDVKSVLLKIAVDEGKHAGILRRFTTQTLKRREKPSWRFRLLASVFSLKMILRMLLTSEQKNAESYAPAGKKNAQMREIANDERRHCKMLEQLIEQL